MNNVLATLDCGFFEITTEGATQIDAIVFVGVRILIAAAIRAVFNK